VVKGSCPVPDHCCGDQAVVGLATWPDLPLATNLIGIPYLGGYGVSHGGGARMKGQAVKRVC